MRHLLTELVSSSKIIFIFAFILFSACRNEELDVYKPNESYRRAGDFIKNNYDLSLFSAGMEHAGLWETINEEGPFTVFAPSNEAFNAIGVYRAGDFDGMDVDSLRFILGCHVLPLRLLTEHIPEQSINNHYPTLAETEAEIGSMRFSYGSVLANASIFGAMVDRRNIILSNGVLHVLGSVIKYDPNITVQQRLESLSRFKVLVAGLKKTNRWEQLAGEGPWTVIAPPDELFAGIGITPDNVDELSEEMSDWLFGVYILPKKQLYISDFNVFTTQDHLPGGDAPLFYLPNYGDFVYGMRNGIYAVNTAYRPNGVSTFYKEIPFTPARTDYRVANGIVHEITQLPLVPDDSPMMDALRAGWTEQ